MKFDYKKYLDIPFVRKGRNKEEGLDCWGLVMCVSFDLGNDIPDFNIDSFSCLEIDVEVNKQLVNWEKQQTPQIGDIVGMKRSKDFPKSVNHFGVYIGNSKFIHTTKEAGVVITSLHNPLYKNIITGFYKCKRK